MCTEVRDTIRRRRATTRKAIPPAVRDPIDKSCRAACWHALDSLRAREARGAPGRQVDASWLVEDLPDFRPFAGQQRRPEKIVLEGDRLDIPASEFLHARASS